MVTFLFLGVVLLCVPFVAEVTGVLVSSSSDESSEELLALALAAGAFLAGGVLTAGVLTAGVLDGSSSSELLSSEDEDSAVFLAGVFAAEVGVCFAAFPLATAGLAGVFFTSVSESELSDESELLLSAFFTAGLAAAAALGVTVAFTFFSSSLELSSSLLLDLAVVLLAGAGGLAAEAGLLAGAAAAGFGLLAAGVSSSESELSVSESELLPAGLAAGFAGVAGLDTSVVAAFFCGSSSDELSESELLSAGLAAGVDLAEVATGLGLDTGVVVVAFFLGSSSSEELSESELLSAGLAGLDTGVVAGFF